MVSVPSVLRVDTGLGDEAAACVLAHGACVVARWQGHHACTDHLASVEALLGSLPRPRAGRHWPPPRGWLPNTLTGPQRAWLTAAGLPVAALDRNKLGNAAHVLEGAGCHVGSAWAWRAEALPWFERWHGEPCVAAVEPVWVRLPRLGAGAQPAPFPVAVVGGDDDGLLVSAVLAGGCVGEHPDAGPPAVAAQQTHDPAAVPAWAGSAADRYEREAGGLCALAWARPTERPLRALVCASVVGGLRFAGLADPEARLGLELVQGDLVVWDPAHWRVLDTLGAPHPCDRLPGCAKAHVLQPVGCHPCRLEPNAVDARVDALRRGCRPPCDPDGRPLYPLAHTPQALAPVVATAGPVPDEPAAHPEEPVRIAVKPEEPVCVTVKPEEPVCVTVKPEEPEYATLVTPDGALTAEERLGWEVDGVLTREAVARAPHFWGSVVQGSRFVEQEDGSIIVENAGVLSAPFTEQQRRQSVLAVGSSCLTATGAPAVPPGADGPRRRTAAEERAAVRTRARAAAESERLEAPGGPLDPAALLPAGWEGDVVARVLGDPAAARALGVSLPPLRWGPRATGCQPWRQALCRLQPRTAGRLAVVTEVTGSLRRAFEQAARGSPPDLDPSPLPPPLWATRPSGRLPGGLAGATLCPWGLPVGVLAGPAAAVGPVVRALTLHDSGCLVVTVPDGADGINAAEEAVRQAIGAWGGPAGRAGASALLVLPPVATPSLLLAPDCGPVVALAVLLCWVDPWLQAHLAHRVAAWSLACLVPCLEPAGTAAPFCTMAVPGRDVVDHLRVVRVQQWRADGDRGQGAHAAQAAHRLRGLVPPDGAAAAPPVADRPDLFALLPADRPFHAQASQRTTLPVPRRPAPAVVRRPRAKKETGKEPAEGAAAADEQAAPLPPTPRRRRAVDPARYTKRVRMAQCLARLEQLPLPCAL